MPVLLDERPAISIGDIEIVGVNYADHLNPGETITGIPEVEQVQGPAELVIIDILVNTVAYIEAHTGCVAGVGQAVLFTVVGEAAGIYTLRISIDTDPLISTAYTPASRHIIRDIILRLI